MCFPPFWLSEMKSSYFCVVCLSVMHIWLDLNQNKFLSLETSFYCSILYIVQMEFMLQTTGRRRKWLKMLQKQHLVKNFRINISISIGILMLESVKRRSIWMCQKLLWPKVVRILKRQIMSNKIRIPLKPDGQVRITWKLKVSESEPEVVRISKTEKCPILNFMIGSKTRSDSFKFWHVRFSLPNGFSNVFGI